MKKSLLAIVRSLRPHRSQGLSHFTHVVVVSSYQDQYAPFESARMEVRAGPSSRALGGGSAR